MISPGDILLFYRARGLARLITLATRSPFYHVAIGVGDDIERAGVRLFPDIDAADVVPADFARFLPAR
jgi:hypothetical protein